MAPAAAANSRSSGATLAEKQRFLVINSKVEKDTVDPKKKTMLMLGNMREEESNSNNVRKSKVMSWCFDMFRSFMQMVWLLAQLTLEIDVARVSQFPTTERKFGPQHRGWSRALAVHCQFWTHPSRSNCLVFKILQTGTVWPTLPQAFV